MNQLVQRDEPRSLIPISAEGLIQDAILHGVPVETMERLLAMRGELRREQAALAFNEAMAQFQADLPPITKSKTAKAGQYSYSYADLGDIQRAIAPRLHACGLSIGFETQQDGDTLNVVCIVRHAGGHCERTSFPVPIDRQARMNDTQKVGSALTYGRRYALTAALGIVTADEDDDGQASGYQAPSKPPQRPQEPARTQETPPSSPAPGRVTEPQIRRLHARIRELCLDRERIKSWILRAWKVDSFTALTQAQYQDLDARLEPWATETLHQRDALAARVLDYAKRKGWSGDLAELPSLAAKVREQAASVRQAAQRASGASYTSEMEEADQLTSLAADIERYHEAQTHADQ